MCGSHALPMIAVMVTCLWYVMNLPVQEKPVSQIRENFNSFLHAPKTTGCIRHLEKKYRQGLSETFNHNLYGLLYMDISMMTLNCSFSDCRCSHECQWDDLDQLPCTSVFKTTNLLLQAEESSRLGCRMALVALGDLVKPFPMSQGQAVACRELGQFLSSFAWMG